MSRSSPSLQAVREVVSDVTSAARSRHFIRTYQLIQQRVQQGEIVVGHVPDRENPADFLTKWVNKDKLLKSVEYLTNSRALNAKARAARRSIEAAVCEWRERACG